MRILVLEPYYGGSHRAFLDDWSRLSRHTWTLLSLPPNKWKWRMRHAAITFADELRRRRDRDWDLLFCSDMLNLAEFKGLAPPVMSRLPSVIYFHENQLTYPVRHEDERDYHFVVTNLISALSASAVWFNSHFHRQQFLNALPGFLKRMPDHQPLDAVQTIRDKSAIQPPGVAAPPPRPPRRPGPLRILWAARWEHDKNPETLFEALAMLQASRIGFQVSVLGEQFRDAPAVFETARRQLADHILHWGFVPSRRDYQDVLLDADIVVSTANHEFFGIGVIEAIAAGAFPLLPERLSYPEILAAAPHRQNFFYDGSPAALAHRLGHAAAAVAADRLWGTCPPGLHHVVQPLLWPHRAARLDDGLDAVVGAA